MSTTPIYTEIEDMDDIDLDEIENEHLCLSYQGGYYDQLENVSTVRKNE